jgi:hypothetical protein
MVTIFCYWARHLYLNCNHQKADRVTRRLQIISEYLFHLKEQLADIVMILSHRVLLP